jgi:Fe-S cluster biogenesis protein NfuA
MTDGFDAREFQGRLRRLDDLLRDVEQFTDPAAQAHMREIARAILELHGTGLGRILEHLAAAGEAGATVLDACARDDAVGGLLLLHGLHPLGLEERVLRALDRVRPRLRSHGGDVELVAVDEDAGAVRLRLLGNCHGCPSSTATMKQTIEEAVVAMAPDATALEVLGVAEGPQLTPDGRPLVVLSAT